MRRAGGEPGCNAAQPRHRHSFRAWVGLSHRRSRPIFNVSTFEGVRRTRPQLHTGLTWPGLVAAIGTHTAQSDKDNAPMFSPCEWYSGHGPSKEEGSNYIVGVHFGVFDFDDLHESKWPQIVGPLEQCRLAHLVMSTWSYTGKRKHEANLKKYVDRNGYRTPAQPGTYFQLRVIVPFNRMVLVSEWHRFWTALTDGLFGSSELVDRSCRDPGHRYYAPVYNPRHGAQPIYIARDGAAVDADALLTSLGPPQPEAAPVVVARNEGRFTRANLALIGRTLKASRSETKREIGVAIMHLVNGEPFATDEQDRTPLAYKIIREIRDRHPAASADAVVDFFVPSLAKMTTKVTRDSLIAQFEHKEPNAIRPDHTTRVAEAFNGTRSEPYVPEDISEMADELGSRTDDLQRRWIIQKGSSYYLLCDGVYRCYSETDVANAALRDLAPAATVGVDLYLATPKMTRRKTISELMETYGTVANDVIVDMTAQKARYDPVLRAFIEAPCPIRVTSQYHEDVHRWLTLLVGEAKAPKLFDWLASVTKLDEPCAALYLEGEPGTGKSFLAHALARIFTVNGAPTPLKAAMADFNELITKCPIVFADETMPTDSKGRLQTAEIREFIQARSRTLNRKYKPAATVEGALRLILAANNKGLLDTNDHMTQHDISAFSERFLHLSVTPEARMLLEQLSREGRGPVRWMAEDTVARHVMWLVENWEVKQEGRFIVSGESKELVESLSTQTGLRAQICQWVANCLLRPTLYVSQYGREHLLHAADGRLLVTARAIHEAWTVYIQDRGTPPTPTAIARALAGLSKEKSVFTHEGGRTHRYKDFDLGALLSWGRATGYLDEDSLRDALVNLEKTLIKQNGVARIDVN